MLKQKITGSVQEVILPDFPDDDDNTVTTTVTKSRRVSFGPNFVKEFIVDSAISAQCMPEYQQPFPSEDSSNADSTHSAISHGTFLLQENLKPHKSDSETADSRPKPPKFASTICFSADSPTADMEFTEGCITLAKSILDKKNKEMTVFIQAKTKGPKEEEKAKEEETNYFEGSQFEMSMTQCFKSKEKKRDEKRFAGEKTKIFASYDNEMSMTRCERLFNEEDDDDDDDESKENRMPLDAIMRYLDKDDSDSDLFNPEKSFAQLLGVNNSVDLSDDSEKLDLNESMEISGDLNIPVGSKPKEMPSGGLSGNERPSDDKMEAAEHECSEETKIVESPKSGCADAPEEPIRFSEEMSCEETMAEEMVEEIVSESSMAQEMVSEKKATEEMVSEEMAIEEMVSEKVGSEEMVSEKIRSEQEVSEKMVTEEMVLQDVVTKQMVSEKGGSEKMSEEMVSEKIRSEQEVSEKMATEEMVSEEMAIEEMVLRDVLTKQMVSEKIRREEEVSEKMATEEMAIEEMVLREVATKQMVSEKVGSEEMVSEKVMTEEIICEKMVGEETTAKKTRIETVAEEMVCEKITAEGEISEKMVTQARIPEKIPSETLIVEETAVEKTRGFQEPSFAPKPTTTPSEKLIPIHEDDTPTEPSLGDLKLIQSLKEQAREKGCVWSLKDVHHPQKRSQGLLSFSCRLLDSTTTLRFSLKKSPEDTLDSCSLVVDRSILLDEEQECRLPEYTLAVGFGFSELKKCLDALQEVATLRHVPYYMDRVNSFLSKMNGHLRQIHAILTSYPGSQLKGCRLSFRLFSFPMFFSCVVSIDLSNVFRLSKASLLFEHDFGCLDEKKVGEIFEESLKGENSLCEFVVRSTRYLVEMERQSGYLSKRRHIRLLPDELKS